MAKKYIEAEDLQDFLQKKLESYKSKMVDPSKYPIDHIDLMALLAREYQSLILKLESFLQEQQEEPDKSLEEKTCKGFEEEFRRFIKKEKEKEPDKSLPYYGDYGIYRVARHFAQWGANHTPLPEDTVLFQKGVEEGRRLEREDIMKDAVEKTVGQLERQWGGNIHFMHGFEVDEMDFPFLNSQECGYGDKVRIIVKEDSHE